MQLVGLDLHHFLDQVHYHHQLRCLEIEVPAYLERSGCHGTTCPENHPVHFHREFVLEFLVVGLVVLQRWQVEAHRMKEMICLTFFGDSNISLVGVELLVWKAVMSK